MAESEGEQDSMVGALYTSSHIIFLERLASIIVALICCVHESDPTYLTFAVAFLVFGLYRLKNSYKYNAARGSKTTTVWKYSALVNGILHCLTLGLFTAYTIAIHDHFSELIAVFLTLGNLIGIPNLSFSSKRMINLQCVALGGPVIIALLSQPVGNHTVLVSLFIPILISVSQFSNMSRATLLQAIRGKAGMDRLFSRLETATSFIQHGILIIGRDDQVDLANARALVLLGIEKDRSWSGKNYEELLDQTSSLNVSNLHALRQLTRQAKRKTNQVETHKELLTTIDGNCLESVISYRNGQLVILIEDVTERIHAENRIAYLASHDALTGLLNRNQFQHLVSEHLALQSNESHMLLMIDLDEFKHANDTYGHTAGDDILRSAAATLARCCGTYAHSARFGGDEFVVYVPQLENPSEATLFPQLLITELAKNVQFAHGNFGIKASIGAVVEDNMPTTIEELLARADLALYESKAKSRGNYTLYTAALDENHRQKQLLKDDLRLAVEDKMLSVVFQPIVNLKSRRASMFEALVRWDHPSRGPVSPAVFVPLAEEIAIVGDITSFVLENSIQACSTWPADVGVSVNLSALDFNNPLLVKQIRNNLLEAGLEPERLQVEITETTFIENKIRVVEAVSELRKMGVKIALDDFGTGYSNFSYLQEINISKLKIDRCFVVDILENQKSSLLLGGISDIAKRLEMTVVVEGVETVEQLAAVQGIGTIDEVQGWIFSKAIATEEAARMASYEFEVPDTPLSELRMLNQPAA